MCVGECASALLLRLGRRKDQCRDPGTLAPSEPIFARACRANALHNTHKRHGRKTAPDASTAIRLWSTATEKVRRRHFSAFYPHRSRGVDGRAPTRAYGITALVRHARLRGRKIPGRTDRAGGRGIANHVENNCVVRKGRGAITRRAKRRRTQHRVTHQADDRGQATSELRARRNPIASDLFPGRWPHSSISSVATELRCAQY